MSTHYEILGISTDASADDIKSAYRKKAFEFHPDRNKASDAISKMQQINEAYKVLSDNSARAVYDRTIKTNNRNPFEDIFGSSFDGSSFNFNRRDWGWGSYSREKNHYGRKTHSVPKCDTLRITIPITFREAYNGCEKQIKINKTVNDETVSEIIKITIDKFTSRESIITLHSQGNRKNGHIDGDLIVVVVYDIPSNIRINNQEDIIITHKISLTDFLLSKIEVQTPMYKSVSMKLALTTEETRSGRVVIGQGWGEYTETIVVFDVVYPISNKENIELLNKLTYEI